MKSQFKGDDETQQQQKAISSFAGSLLRETFGKGPKSAYTKIGDRYVLILLEGFLSPIEEVLVKEQGEDALHVLRESMMNHISSSLHQEVEKITGSSMNEFFFDWNIKRKSGILIGLKPEAFRLAGEENESVQKDFPHKKALEEKISLLSEEAERRPDYISSIKVDNRTFLIVREGILVEIEKKLIEMKEDESLKIAKRVVEKELFNRDNALGHILKEKIQDIFIDWNFEKDRSTVVIITRPSVPYIK